VLANVPRPGKDFAGLRHYLMEGKQGADKDRNRVAWITTRNLATADPEIAAKVMTATAALSVRVERPVYHLIVSWHPDEEPGRGDMDQVAATTLEDVGLAEHQAVIIGHGDTANPHLHMIVNRVHPGTGVAWSTSHDYRRIERSMRRQAEAHGFAFVPGRHTEPERFKERADEPSEGEYQLLRRKKRESIPQWSREQSKALGDRLKPVLEEAQSWREVEEVMDAFGGKLVAKGQGMVVTDYARSGYAKLSSLGSDIRMKNLEERFGETWGEHCARHAGVEVSTSRRFRPVVSEMDVVLGLYRMGLAERSNVKAVADEGERRRAAAPVAVQIEREMRQALKAATGKAPREQRRREPSGSAHRAARRQQAGVRGAFHCARYRRGIRLCAVPRSGQGRSEVFLGSGYASAGQR